MSRRADQSDTNTTVSSDARSHSAHDVNTAEPVEYSPPTPPVSGRRGLWQQLWPETVVGVVVGDLIFALLLGAFLFWLSDQSDDRRTEEAQRLADQRTAEAARLENRVENLRFVREVAVRETGPMPFSGLDLEGMSLRALSLPCRDEEVIEACSPRGKADFTDANLRGADMVFMDLTGADFTGAELSDANIRDSNLSGAIFVGAHLEGAVLEDVCYSGTTIWPDDFDPPEPSTAACDAGLGL